MTVRELSRKVATWTTRQRWSVRPPRPAGRPAVRVSGPDWFADLVSDEFDVVTDDDSDAPTIRWELRPTQMEPGVVSRPFVSPRRSHPGSRRRLPKGCPAGFRELDASARRTRPSRAAGMPDSSDVAESNEVHLAFRSAHQHSLLDAIGYTSSGIASSRPLVDVVCVSRRPGRAAVVTALFDAQTYQHRRLTIVTTVPAEDHPTILELRATHPEVRIVARPGATLGACLNEFVESAAAPLVAKWDDDDWYGPNYLLDLVLDRNATGATVTGKHSYFTYLEHLDSTYVRFPEREFRDTSFLAGGTLLIDVTRLDGVRFPNVNLGEDRGFLADCVRRGLRVRSADSFNYVQFRGAENTWKVPDAHFLAHVAEAGAGLRLDLATV